MALAFAMFVQHHPSMNKRDVLAELCGLSAGAGVRRLEGSDAKKLTELWEQVVDWPFSDEQLGED
jgi:hypothetical protein